MEKKILIIITALFIAVAICCSVMGLYSPEYLTQNWTPPTQPNCEDMEIYKYLRSHITDESSLEEMVDTFEEMCQIPHDTTCNMYRFEAHTYEFEGQTSFYITISHQFEVPGYYEMLDVGIDICYTPDADTEDFDIVKFYEEDWQGFVDYIRKTDVYKTLLEKEIEEYYVFGFSW